jgi:hypothetical protein
MVLGGARARGQTASDVTGLFYTGDNSSYGLVGAGQQDANWDVTYASTNGGNSASTANEGYGYVISASNVSGSGYTPNTTSAQWITAPGATNSSGTSPNTGGDFLPGNGNAANSGGQSNEGIYVYTLAFQIEGSGSKGTTVSNNIQITMTLAADDQYSVYVNPAGNGTSIPTTTAAASQTGAWSNKSQITLQNYGSGGANNSTFKIGTNYIVVVVDNTNSAPGYSGSTSANASGLLVYQTGDALVGGKPVPEVGAWLPILGALGVYGIFAWRRREPVLQLVRVS